MLHEGIISNSPLLPEDGAPVTVCWGTLQRFSFAYAHYTFMPLFLQIWYHNTQTHLLSRYLFFTFASVKTDIFF